MGRANYIIVQPLSDDGAIYDGDNNIIKSMPIESIFNDDCYEVMDHIFYIKNADELRSYELLEDFATLVYNMTLNEFCELENIHSVFVCFKTADAEISIFGVFVEEDVNGYDYHIVDFQNEECDCRDDCSDCPNGDIYEDIERKISSNYFFGYDW